MPSLTYTPGADLSLSSGRLTLWNYHFATDRRKPFFHPMNSSAGVPLTACEPSDHVWHRGHWFSWKFLNGVNYWEETPDGSPNGSTDGLTEFIGHELVSAAPDSVTIHTTNQFHPPGGSPIALEHRRITLRSPASDGTYVIDWLLTFSAVSARVVLDRTPITPDTQWGGYAGLSYRASLAMRQFRLTDSESHQGSELSKPARWMDLSGASADGRVAGLAMFDHPTNPRYPSRWKCFSSDGFGYINPAFLMTEPYNLEPGNPLMLRYRVLIHDGPADPDRLKRESEIFIRP